MEFKQRYSLDVPRPQLWDTLMDVHAVASCLDGVESLTVDDDDHYQGTLAVRMGAVRLKLDGHVAVLERDRDNWTGVLEATAKDAKAGGGFRATLEMRLDAPAPAASELELTLATAFLGRMGQLGRPLIKKKITTMMDDFAEALRARHAPS